MGHRTVLLKGFCTIKSLVPLPKYAKIGHKY